MKTCSRCGLKKEESDFFIKDRKTGRRHAQCKECYKQHRATYYSAHYKQHHAEYLARAKQRRSQQRADFRTNMIKFLEGKYCVICGEKDIRTFEFDHLNPDEKSFSISQAVRLGMHWDAVLVEIKKCRILCANCHKKHTAQQFGWYKI